MSQDFDKILAHSIAKNSGRAETLTEHTFNTEELAARFGEELKILPEASMAALGHDLAKMGTLFQKRIRGQESHVDHWTCGAWFLMQTFKEKATFPAFCAAGHHMGLKTLNSAFTKMQSDTAEDLRSISENYNLKLSEIDIDDCKRFLNNGPLKSKYSFLLGNTWTVHDLYMYKKRFRLEPFSVMLAIRMLYSTLVDADFIATEGHFNGTRDTPYISRPFNQTMLQPDIQLDRLLENIEKMRKEKKASDNVLAVRKELLDYCLNAAENPTGIFTLTAPTGSGKTLAMLAFALKHAIRNNLKRIIIVLPFLSIIEQTANVCRKNLFLKNTDSENPFLVEDHSRARQRHFQCVSQTNAQTHIDNNSNESSIINNTFEKDNVSYYENLLAENWDAPLIITSSIQFLESLHSNRPGACRKLHNIANSVILLDEVQTIPFSLAVPTLGTLSALASHWNSSVVMATATQPAFSSMGNKLIIKKTQPQQTKAERYGLHPTNSSDAPKPTTGIIKIDWTPKEIVGFHPTGLTQSESGKKNDTVENMFKRCKRTNVTWIREDDGHCVPYSATDNTDETDVVSFQCLASLMLEKKRALCIVNLKKQTQCLIEEIQKQNNELCNDQKLHLCHLSTSMCPRHREDMLKKITKILEDEKEQVLLVSTQCIEAGVDIDFPVVFRAMAPLDALIQAMGRCNRNQKNDRGDFLIFVPEKLSDNDILYPGGKNGIYGLAAGIARDKLLGQLRKSNKIDLDLPDLIQEYFRELIIRIKDNTEIMESVKNFEYDFEVIARNYHLINNEMINVLVPYNKTEYDHLVEEVKRTGLTSDWIRRSRDLTVSVFKTQKSKIENALVPVPVRSFNKNPETTLYADDWFYLNESNVLNISYDSELLGLRESGNTDFII